MVLNYEMNNANWMKINKFTKTDPHIGYTSNHDKTKHLQSYDQIFIKNTIQCHIVSVLFKNKIAVQKLYFNSRLLYANYLTFIKIKKI